MYTIKPPHQSSITYLTIDNFMISVERKKKTQKYFIRKDDDNG